MVYGIVSQVDDATTRAYFKNKRVPDVNVVHITQIASLLQMLKSGDVVFVVSVNRFWSVSQFFQFGKFCMSNQSKSKKQFPSLPKRLPKNPSCVNSTTAMIKQVEG